MTPDMPRVAVLIVALLAAGCLGDDGRDGDGNDGGTPGPPGPTATPAPPTDGPPPPMPTVVELLPDFALVECRGISIRHQRPVADVQELLPAGFSAAIVAGSQPLGLVEGLGTVTIDLFACGNLTVGGQPRVPATYFGQLAALVEPPTERVPGTPDATFHEYVFRVLAAEDVLAALWPAAGYDTRSGAAALRIAAPVADVPDVGLRTADGNIGDQYQFTASAAPELPPPLGTSRQGAFARYTALADGSVLVWTGTYALGAARQGEGMVAVPADDPFMPFETGEAVLGTAFLYEAGAMEAMDLRRVFTPP